MYKNTTLTIDNFTKEYFITITRILSCLNEQLMITVKLML